jgi:hypothetical protein
VGLVTEILLAAELNNNTRMMLWPSAIQLTGYLHHVRGLYSEPKYYVETDSVGNTVFVWVYNVGTQVLVNVNAYASGTFNLKCAVDNGNGIQPGAADSCSFSATSDGKIDVWAHNIGFSTNWSAINTLDYDR